MKLKTLLILMAAIFVAGFLILTLMGFTFLSRPKDLGISYSSSDLESLKSKAPYKIVIVDGDDATLIYSGSMDVKGSFSSEELTARVNSNSWKYNMGRDTQIKVNQDGTVEMSGRLLKGNLGQNTKRFNINPGDGIMDKVNMLPVDPVYYVKGKGTIVNDQVNLDVEELEIGSFKIPGDQIPKQQIESMIENSLNTVEGLSVRSLTFDGGNMKLDAKLPDTVTVSK